MIYALEDRRVELLGTEHYVADNASVIGSVVLHDRSSVWFNAVLRGDNEPIVLGEGSNIQDGTVCHTDPGFPLHIGRFVTVGHLVMLHGCDIGDFTLIGIGAVIMNGARIGRNCLIGAKSLIPEGREVPDNSLVVGAPGRVIRQRSDEELAQTRAAADSYIHKIRRYRHLFPDPRYGDDA